MLLTTDQEEQALLADPLSYGKKLYAALFPSASPAHASLQEMPERLMLVLQGRALDEHDTSIGEPVVLINQTIAKRYWNGRSPVIRRLSFMSWNALSKHERALWLNLSTSQPCLPL